MGGSNSALNRKGRPPLRLLLLGFGNSGKSSLLSRISGTATKPGPTQGFNFVNTTWNHTQFIVWDIAGSGTNRTLWRNYYKGTNAVIFLVDATDVDTLSDVKDELHMLLREEELVGIPLIIFGNKSDLPGCRTPSQLEQDLDVLTFARSHPLTALIGGSVKNDVGIDLCYKWLERVFTRKIVDYQPITPVPATLNLPSVPAATSVTSLMSPTSSTAVATTAPVASTSASTTTTSTSTSPAISAGTTTATAVAAAASTSPTVGASSAASSSLMVGGGTGAGGHSHERGRVSSVTSGNVALVNGLHPVTSSVLASVTGPAPVGPLPVSTSTSTTASSATSSSSSSSLEAQPTATPTPTMPPALKT